VNTSASARPLNTRIKSNLARELEASNRKLRELRKAQIGDTTDEKELAKQERILHQKKLTRDELFAHRKELAYLKMRESQKSAKARMQNKIKSKKFHKLQKRQKMLEQMKEFELLQKTNPEAALEKLNALEKSRVQERASLRHKNTGTWAKNLQVRAKYDNEIGVKQNPHGIRTYRLRIGAVAISSANHVVQHAAPPRHGVCVEEGDVPGL